MFSFFKKKKDIDISFKIEEETEKFNSEVLETYNIINQNSEDIQSTPEISYKPSKLTIEKISLLADEDIIKYLKESWNMKLNKPIEVWGCFKSEFNKNWQKYFFKLKNVKDLNNNTLEYPIENLKYKKFLSNDGIYIPSRDLPRYIKDKLENDNLEIYISCNLVLSPKSEREKHINPLMLQADTKSIKTLKKIPKERVLKTKEGMILIEDSIINHYKIINKKNINEEIYNDKIQLEEIKQNIKLLKVEHEKQKEEILISQENHKNFLININSKKEEKKLLLKDIENIKEQIKKDKKMREKNLKKIKYFIKSKADSLMNLGFISQNEYDEIMENYPKNINTKDNFLDFKKDLDGDFSKSISHIQAYLFAKNSIYRRYLLEDYFTSLQTNDLVILAGDSGSGKTNLVKKFAEVVGGIAKIIPVKPNWTSSDDLLGYYNPLQKTYISTPFLDAILEASRNPDTPYFICLDEMNLARVEYYFADFLSLLEERDTQPLIPLYSSEESSHTLSEFNNVLSLIEASKEKFKKNNIVSFLEILKDEEINQELKRVFGFSDKDSLIKYHTDLRRMLSGVLNIPSSIVFPKNVRIIGTINIDETTHYLSPKILDRAHIIKLNSPNLSDWSKIEEEVKKSNIKKNGYKIKFEIDAFGNRETYPQFNPKDSFCKEISNKSEEYFKKLGIEVSLRAVRQGLYYNELFSKFNADKNIALNNFLLHKILPKFSFDGNVIVEGKEKLEIVKSFKNSIKKVDSELVCSAKDEVDLIINKSSENDGIVNYWA